MPLTSTSSRTTSLTPLEIGPFALTSPVLLAPMAALTDRPFRMAVKRLGCGLAFSEMIASDCLLDPRKRASRDPDMRGEAGPLAVQLAGRDPETMARAAAHVHSLGAEIIDINFGCPAKRVVNGLAGSALMREPELARDIVAAVREATDAPVTVKTRLGWDEHEINAPQFAAALVEAGARLVTVHARTRCQKFAGRADWAAVRAVKDAIGVPVIVNGDIGSCKTAAEAFTESGADGVMLGRETAGRPWLPEQVAQFLTSGEVPADPTLPEIGAIVARHFEDALDWHGEARALVLMRKHFAAYAQHLEDGAGFRRVVNQADRADKVRAAIARWFACDMARLAA